MLAVYQAAAEAVRRARSGDGPTLLECRTYRTRPHAEGMGDYTYRTRDEVDSWKTRCPIARLRAVISQSKAATTTEIEAIEAEIDTIVDDAHQFAESSPWPEPGDGRSIRFQ